MRILDHVRATLVATGVRLRRSSRGESMTSYAMLAGLIAVVAIGSIAATGGKIDGAFCTFNQTLASAFGGDTNADCRAIASNDDTDTNGGGTTPGGNQGGNQGGNGGEEEESGAIDFSFLAVNDADPRAAILSLPTAVANLEIPSTVRATAPAGGGSVALRILRGGDEGA